MNSAIIVAAGEGKRFGGEIPKQFVTIHGKPLIIHTIERFARSSEIDEIILVLAATRIEDFQKDAAKFNLTKLKKIVPGGKTRAESVFRGLQAVAENSEIVAVHDGARPLVSVEEISATLEKAAETGAACLVASLSDTIKEVADGKIIGTIDRANLRRALTPQCFRLEILKKAFAGADLGEDATDECFLVEKLGYNIAAVEGSARNIKITTPDDLILAETFLKTETAGEIA
jgi:2-C-methyl-D-erythritol 4-phosphate cytidylyltransferase